MHGQSPRTWSALQPDRHDRRNGRFGSAGPGDRRPATLRATGPCGVGVGRPGLAKYRFWSSVLTWKTQRVQSEWDTGRFADVGSLDAQIRDHRGVSQLIEAMRADLAQHPGEWENHTLDRYLEALGAVIEARGEAVEQPTWQLVAQLLVSASGYE